jgi:glycosyltransferase involved in cell wall biosynthesis
VRILVINNVFPPVIEGGYEIACEGVVSRLRRSHDVMVLTSDRDLPRTLTGGAGEASSWDQFGVRRVLPWRPGVRADALRAPSDALTAARATRQVLEDHDPELVYIWNGSALPQVSLRLAETRGCPVLFSVLEHWYARIYRSDMFLRYLHPDGVYTYRALPMRAMSRLWNQHPELRMSLAEPVPAAIAWNSAFMRRENPVPSTTVPVLQETLPVGSPRDVEFARLERRRDDPPFVLFAGRVTRIKGPHLLIEAVARLGRRDGLRPRVVLAGPVSTEERRELEQLAAELGVGDQVELPGQLDAAAVGDAMSRAAALVVPSMWQEPMPLVSVEGAMARVPLALARSGGMPEQFSDLTEALFFDIGDADGLGACLRSILTDERAAAERAERAFERAQEYRFEAYLDHTEGFIERARAALGGRLSGQSPATGPRH